MICCQPIFCQPGSRTQANSTSRKLVLTPILTLAACLIFFTNLTAIASQQDSSVIEPTINQSPFGDPPLEQDSPASEPPATETPDAPESDKTESETEPAPNVEPTPDKEAVPEKELVPETNPERPFDPPGTPAIQPATKLADQEDTKVAVPEDFLALRKAIAGTEKEINRLYGSIPIGFPDRQREIRENIEKLKSRNQQFKAGLDAAARASFQSAPKQNPDAAQHLFQLMSTKIDGQAKGQAFDPVAALEIGDLLIKSDVAGAPVLYQAFRASFALQDFERAGMYLEKVLATGAKLPPDLEKNLSEAKSKWQRELKLRQAEATADDLPRVKLETTEGTIVVELFENESPIAVANFISLVEQKFYDGLAFHLVRPGQYALTGSPSAGGKGDAGYYIPCETDNENLRGFFSGTLGMMHTGKDTGSSQFFITHQPLYAFDGLYTSFGRVIEGMDVVYQLRAAEPVASSILAEDKNSESPSEIISATVLRKREHVYEPTKLPKPISGLDIFGGGALPTAKPAKPEEVPNVAPSESE